MKKELMIFTVNNVLENTEQKLKEQHEELFWQWRFTCRYEGLNKVEELDDVNTMFNTLSDKLESFKDEIFEERMLILDEDYQSINYYEELLSRVEDIQKTVRKVHSRIADIVHQYAKVPYSQVYKNYLNKDKQEA